MIPLENHVQIKGSSFTTCMFQSGRSFTVFVVQGIHACIVLVDLSCLTKTLAPGQQTNFGSNKYIRASRLRSRENRKSRTTQFQFKRSKTLGDIRRQARVEIYPNKIRSIPSFSSSTNAFTPHPTTPHPLHSIDGSLVHNVTDVPCLLNSDVSLTPTNCWERCIPQFPGKRIKIKDIPLDRFSCIFKADCQSRKTRSFLTLIWYLKFVYKGNPLLPLLHIFVNK